MRTLLFLPIVSSIILLSQSIYSNPTVYAAENLDRYWSVLTGDQQIPPANTDARGYVGLKFQDDLTRLVFIVNGENIGNVTGIYIYQNGEYRNGTGTAVLDLLNGTRKIKKDIDKFVSTTSEGKMVGTLSIGGATKHDLQGKLKGKSLSDLLTIVVNGTAYIVIHTKDFPDGEIGGRSFIGIDRLFPDFTDIKWK
jgi:hypothetical protein